MLTRALKPKRVRLLKAQIRSHGQIESEQNRYLLVENRLLFVLTKGHVRRNAYIETKNLSLM
jgi:hypothetical protein